jgi:succinoglycan biosynthesis protein ExoM
VLQPACRPGSPYSDAVNLEVDHITVCVCTFKRPALLQALLSALSAQETDGCFSYSVVVVDNDCQRSAAAICEEFRNGSSVALLYDVEPEQNIALARNRAIRHAVGQLVALIDDDEVPGRDWLWTLHRALRQHQASGVLGPVFPSYEAEPPRWVIKGRFHERPQHESGAVLDWKNTRTGNAIICRTVFEGIAEPFRPAFGMGGEDRDFFRRMIALGHRFVWCAEAPVWETVPAARCTRSFMLRRALLRGTAPQFGPGDLLKSLVAVPVYTLSLPFCLMCGQHVFMKRLISDCDHLSRLCATVGVRWIRERNT